MQDARAGVYIEPGGNGFGLGAGFTGQVRRGNGIGPGGFILQGQVVDVAGKRRAGVHRIGHKAGQAGGLGFHQHNGQPLK